MRSSALLAFAVVGACSDSGRPPEPRTEPPPRRVIEPPEGVMRSGPPYAIRAEGVGPYKPGDSMESMQEQLRDLRIARVDLPEQASLIRVDNEQIIIGGDPSTSSTVTFVGVLGGREVARTDSGIAVGSSREELVRSLGPELEELERARDPHLVAVSGMRPARFVLEDDRIAAIVIGVDRRLAKHGPDIGPPPEPVCPRGTVPPARDRDRGRTFGTCMTGNPELVEIDADDVVTIRAADGDRALSSFTLRNVVFAAPLRNPVDQRDELIAVTRTDDAQQRVWSVVGYRFDGKSLVRAFDPTPVYKLSQTRWSELRDVELYFELTSHLDSIEVGGLLTSRGTRGEDTGKGIRAVVVIGSVPPIVRRHDRSGAGHPGDAGAGDADAGPGDASPTPHDAGVRSGSNSSRP
ncbi:MAG: hypothetical protein KF773_37925 [Deltaproteobacteria bacterium]|nr:hypothetical protein [Deltaproteobacteria bacterium]MCW5808556.1 hypothetical protein [Deltaproteobacteria bacterium]